MMAVVSARTMVATQRIQEIVEDVRQRLEATAVATVTASTTDVATVVETEVCVLCRYGLSSSHLS